MKTKVKINGKEITVKIREPYAPKEKVVKSKKVYNRKNKIEKEKE